MCNQDTHYYFSVWKKYKKKLLWLMCGNVKRVEKQKVHICLTPGRGQWSLAHTSNPARLQSYIRLVFSKMTVSELEVSQI